ncbi:hypothetical protein PanWU01x14_087010 [Parasponia andersonii]|uniref:Uncharacterized protein n=1 Tax=Parasponia andersonii TaxID=3476 RepID=A0A2P5D8J0_PARAD|nr:hypothetical protein PanWU01x14_087010 [Parasponia andersonii]
MEHDDGVAFVVLALGEGPGGLLEDDGGGGGGVIDDGDLIHVFGVDQVLDYGPGMEDPLLELIDVEIVRLSQILPLPCPLGLDDETRAGPEAAVVDPGNSRVVVREL